MRPDLGRTRLSRRHRSGTRLLIAGFLLRALIPVGFMPAPFDSGGPVMVCHGGTAGAFFQMLADRQAAQAPALDALPSAGLTTAEHATRHSPEHSPEHSPDHPPEHAPEHSPDHAPDASDRDRHDGGWDQCPTGANASFAALVPVLSLDLLSLSQQSPDSEPYYGVPIAPPGSYLARAPPASHSRPVS